MSDSNVRDKLDAKHERNDERRIEAVKRWAAYVESAPPEEWGPQLNKLVNAQVQSARDSQLPAEHYRCVSEAVQTDE
ncbi:hypothetical protein [Halogranum rubrum]|uniref:Uncharacterized protein n=1 Tax=Halogranum salarium B-1 TaxID=1210908 RepID=J3JCU6_9EURY|nr:hypothetical protein [Halogranum salarium]EJN56919.1 hypothetical protein HSB1_47360 [Halogranum salarium B-1]